MPMTARAAMVLPSRKRLVGGSTGAGGGGASGLGYQVAAGAGGGAAGAGAYGADTVAGAAGATAGAGPVTERWHSQQKLAYSPISAPQCGQDRLVELAAGRSSTAGNGTSVLPRCGCGPS